MKRRRTPEKNHLGSPQKLKRRVQKKKEREVRGSTTDVREAPEKSSGEKIK